MDAVGKAEKSKYGRPTVIFLDVLENPSRLLEKQMNEFLEHIKANKQHCPLNKHEKI